MVDELKSADVRIDGMHCAHCEVLVERGLRAVAGVTGALANHRTGTVDVSYKGPLDIDGLRRAVGVHGYTISSWSASKPPRNTARDYAEIGAALLLVLGLFLAFRRFDILPDNIAVPSSVSYTLAFIVGLVASITTCMAITGGLLVAVAAKYNEANPGLTAIQRLKPHLYFNVGRVASYAALGGATGALGSALLLSQEVNGIIVIAVSTTMIVLGLQMLRLLPRVRLLPTTLSKRLTHRLHEIASRDANGSAFLLGASTFFVPCGFTQALQLYVLPQGNASTGALVMLAFALGTLPALLSLSALSSLVQSSFQKHFLKVAGVAVVLLGLFNVQNGLTLTGYPVVPGAQPVGQASVKIVPIVDGTQIAEMKIIDYGYEPYQFVVKQGIPVQWRIDAHDAAGCGLILIAPKIAVRRFLAAQATNIVSFIPQEPGEIAFNCGMGMMTPGAKFIVVRDTAS